MDVELADRARPVPRLAQEHGEAPHGLKGVEIMVGVLMAVLPVGVVVQASQYDR